MTAKKLEAGSEKYEAAKAATISSLGTSGEEDYAFYEVSFEKDGACWLGVPGVFHPNEQKVARSFGFDQFMRPDEGEIELPAEEREEDDEFGYWCRTVSTVIGE